MYTGLTKLSAPADLLALFYTFGRDSFARDLPFLFGQQLDMTQNLAYTLLCMLTGEIKRILVAARGFQTYNTRNNEAYDYVYIFRVSVSTNFGAFRYCFYPELPHVTNPRRKISDDSFQCSHRKYYPACATKTTPHKNFTVDSFRISSFRAAPTILMPNQQPICLSQNCLIHRWVHWQWIQQTQNFSTYLAKHTGRQPVGLNSFGE